MILEDEIKVCISLNIIYHLNEIKNKKLYN